MKIDQAGRCSFGHFNPNHSLEHFWRNPRFRMLSWFDEVDEPEAIDGQIDLLIQTAKSMGVSEDEVLALLDLGYDPCENRGAAVQSGAAARSGSRVAVRLLNLEWR